MDITPHDQKYRNLLEETKALLHGDFTLKSGFKTNYFINFGKINSGKYLSELSDICADYIIEKINSGELPEFDVIFGAAYKGIPLCTSVVQSLWRKHNKNYGFTFNRKEAKTHGEGGMFIGSELAGKKILIIDDVLVTGTAIMDCWELLKDLNATGNVVGLLVALDREQGGKQALLDKGITSQLYAVSTAEKLGIKLVD